MAQSIGLRIYKLYFTESRSSEPLDFDLLEFRPMHIVKAFLKKHVVKVEDEDRQRSWYFEPLRTEKRKKLAGFLQYGASGIASKLLDGVSNKKKYDRLETDVEQIPIYFQFWQPPDANFLMVALQSYGPKSCVDLLQSALRINIQNQHNDVVPRFKKLMPNDSKASLFGAQPVKRLTFVAARTSRDVAEQLSSFRPKDEVDVEISLKSRRSGTLGPLSKVMSDINTLDGVLMHDGVEFDEAYAQVRVNGKLRKVGVLGPSSDSGTIDVSSDVKLAGGHPKFKSMDVVADGLISDFYEVIVG